MNNDFDLKLEQVKHGEITKESLLKEYGSSVNIELIDEKLQELKDSDEQILEEYSVEKMRTAVNKKLGNGFVLQADKAENTDDHSGEYSADYLSGHKKIRKTTLIRTFSFAAAAVLVAAFCIPQLTTRSKVNQVYQTADSTERTKGNSKTALQVYLQKGSEAVKLKDGDFAGEGSVLQLSYQAGKAEYGMIFSVDGNGTVTQHLPVNGSESVELVKDKEVLLDFAYELDNAPDYEKFYFVTAKKAFTMEAFSEKSVKEKKLDEIEFIIKKK